MMPRANGMQAHERVITEPLPPVVAELLLLAGEDDSVLEADATLDGAALVACLARRYGL